MLRQMMPLRELIGLGQCRPQQRWTQLVVLAGLCALTGCIELEPLEYDPLFDDPADAPARTEQTARPRGATGKSVEGLDNQIRVSDRQRTTLTRYFSSFQQKDLDGHLEVLDDDLVSINYPNTIIGQNLLEMRANLAADFKDRPNTFLITRQQMAVDRDNWFVVGELIDGRERVPFWSLLGFNEAGDKINVNYSQFGAPAYVSGPFVPEPTPQMRDVTQALDQALADKNFSDAAAQMAENVALFTAPPKIGEGQSLAVSRQVITGASDVASVLIFKWGEGAWAGEPMGEHFMQFVLRVIPGDTHSEGGRVALFTFDADPASPSFEKIIRVDIMGQ